MLNDATCHRCAAILPDPDGTSLRRCTACGVPQLRLSAELRAQAAAEQERYERSLAARDRSAGDAWDVQWRQIVGLAAIGSVATILLCAVFPPLVAAAWWVPAAVLLVYRFRFPRTVWTAMQGARVGALVGVFCSAGTALALTCSLVVRRFGLHRMSGFDALYSGAWAAAERQTMARNGAEAASAFASVASPEFRAGMLLLFAMLAAMVFLLLCVACGAISAAAQRRAPRPLESEDQTDAD